MSTFNGLVPEFPDIRIDFFRHHEGVAPPLACFLSHVHSDHLSGLETLRSPFVYCSAATREILLRLERYPCRLSYAEGILEARQQTYKHLSKVIGQGKAILYTGDIRSEPWFVNSITRSPALIEYTYGLKTLDTIYLDTSFTDDIPFQTKAEGIAELLRKVQRYPKDTVFYIQSWTYGYEDVWIHVDDYKLRIYNSLNTTSEARPNFGNQLTSTAAALTGFMCGNTPQPGCLTSDQNVRLHSCESGNLCAIAKNSSVVRIQPVIASFPDGGVIQEAGIGGGGEDLEREMELGVPSRRDLQSLLEIIGAIHNMPEEARGECARILTDALASGRNLPLNINISSCEDAHSTDLRQAILSVASTNSRSRAISSLNFTEGGNGSSLPNIIRFPYSRHSSYAELCHLVEAFRPSDVWPCTFHLDVWQSRGMSVESLFGKYCSSNRFAHDMRINSLAMQGIRRAREEPYSQGESCRSRSASPLICTSPSAVHGSVSAVRDAVRERSLEPLVVVESDSVNGEDDSQTTDASLTSSLSMRHSAIRRDAYDRMLQGTAWHSIELISTGCNHSFPETEL
ncbi:hypothetical protein BBK36DRAFT_1201930 [Trichoderma citrinoviride]|uniref:Protein artemis n=1 Tax=Trichoderma citrinoviride TaxID=58853 RepID=A0A2T4B872_9HYPO|nr:hypothetical protein BBK36DRAFT_1201930 [Trichoderma citrinoviride]PTB65522.1 hypothetical protein BBK36DRAFT_1201930 [Trichoderma citrinoviride]